MNVPAPRSFTRADSDAVYALADADSPLGLKVQDALNIIDKALADYGQHHLALSFNGGKDCQSTRTGFVTLERSSLFDSTPGTVLIHLLAASFFRSLPPSTTPLIKCVYVRCSAPFPQVEAFVTICTQRYHLDLSAVDGSMKEALGEYIDQRKGDANGAIQAILVGTRRGDPHGATLKPFEKTDHGWPDFMRVHPILDWTYSEIWDFLRDPTLTLGGGRQEWCELYDYGYTSLGSTHNTFPNPLLKATDDPNVLGGWRPAWELQDESQERAGRGIPPVEP
ncbi:FAD synthetase, partial [Phenoliferia sp. Uapishka_3]